MLETCTWIRSNLEEKKNYIRQKLFRKILKEKFPKNYLRNVMLLQQRSSRGRLTVKLIRDCCWLERANLPPVHATASGQNTAKQGRRCARSTARSCAAPVVVVVSCFAAAFTTTKENPKNNQSSTTILQLLCLYLLARLLGLLRPAAQYQSMINWSMNENK